MNKSELASWLVERFLDVMVLGCSGAMFWYLGWILLG